MAQVMFDGFVRSTIAGVMNALKYWLSAWKDTPTRVFITGEEVTWIKSELYGRLIGSLRNHNPAVDFIWADDAVFFGAYCAFLCQSMYRRYRPSGVAPVDDAIISYRYSI